MSTDPIDPPVPEPSAPANVVPEPEEMLHFDYPGSDIVLRSCDSHNFHVPKFYFINSSPVLRELIVQTVSNTSDITNGEGPVSLLVVSLPESRATLYYLLTFIFPVEPILPSTSEKIMGLLAVAQKYQMKSVLSHIRGIIGARKDPPFIRPETALHIYFLAQQQGLRQEAVQAARVTLRLPMVLEDLVDKLEFSDMTGVYLYELWKYHEHIRTDLKSGVPEFRNSRLPEGVKALRCEIPYSYTDSPSLQWLDKYIESIAETPHLFDLIEFENAWARHMKEIEASYSRNCSCVNISNQLRRDFWEALTAFVDGAIERADSTLALVNEGVTPEYSYPSFVPLRLNLPDASIIVRSSDQVNFRVHKSLLAMSSPFFEDLLSLPQPPDDDLADGLPVVQLSEDAGLLNCLVSLLYPIHRPPITPRSYEKVFALLAACQKYDMSSIQSDIRDKVERGTFPAPVRAQAFRAYALASSLGLITEMEDAARLTLSQPMTFESLGEGLRYFKGQALCELIRYRAANSGSSSSSQGPNSRRRRGNHR
ncbi:hypothetical protein V8E53_004405 [Lactarius tabidus]